MPNFFNTFDHIYEPDTHYKHARTLRTGFWSKIVATFSVFFGNPVKDKQNREQKLKYTGVGLVDVPTLGITLLAQNLFIAALDYFSNLLKEKKSGKALAFFFLVMLPTWAVTLAPILYRLSAAFIMTLASTLIVGAVNIGAYFASKKYVKAISAVFAKVNPDLDNVEVAISGTTQDLTIRFTDHSANSKKYSFPQEHEVTLNVSKPSDGTKNSNRTAVKALLKLHAGGEKHCRYLYQQWVNIDETSRNKHRQSSKYRAK